ncbi:hypothetical protein M8332_06120 [Fructilactobacillus ixorae]|uniref:Acetyltransferase n=1 Tax=Fructilactobacillus ixorae TaxID=1750535 RepID=A0ABY5C6E6_9LACO|nr:hypothetical protein [Fructilactobacillus ixorae]USS93168.1 hypothetical protein M8332_06120 [Fructilactobacillus ixorae]
MPPTKTLHTLGPQATDCYRAALVYEGRHPDVDWQVKLHASFPAVLQAVEQDPGAQILLPAALQLADGTDWGTLHYRYLERWQLVDVFTHPLDPLVLVHSLRRTGIVDLHPATAEVVQHRLPATTQFRYASSKWAAYQAYQRDGEFCVTNQANLQSTETVLKRWQVDMVWTVYQV